jgi:hypothetical protein
MKKLYSALLITFFLMFFSSWVYAQRMQVTAIPGNPVDPSLVIFSYDDSGNQIRRGPELCMNCCATCRPGEESPSTLADLVANKIQAAPVPVKTDLTVLWDLSIRDFIVSIDLLPYNAFNITESVSIRSLNTNSYIFRMSHLPYGVYYLKFNLSDGSIYTRTVTKN